MLCIRIVAVALLCALFATAGALRKQSRPRLQLDQDSRRRGPGFRAPVGGEKYMPSAKSQGPTGAWTWNASGTCTTCMDSHFNPRVVPACKKFLDETVDSTHAIQATPGASPLQGDLLFGSPPKWHKCCCHDSNVQDCKWVTMATGPLVLDALKRSCPTAPGYHRWNAKQNAASSCTVSYVNSFVAKFPGFGHAVSKCGVCEDPTHDPLSSCAQYWFTADVYKAALHGDTDEIEKLAGYARDIGVPYVAVKGAMKEGVMNRVHDFRLVAEAEHYDPDHQITSMYDSPIVLERNDKIKTIFEQTYLYSKRNKRGYDFFQYRFREGRHYEDKFHVEFVGETGEDVGGPMKDWARLVLQSTVRPNGTKPSDAFPANGNPPLYLLEDAGGVLAPTFGSPEDRGLGGHLSRDSQYLMARYEFLGKWLALAYVVGEMTSSYNLHPLIYESIIAGSPVAPKDLDTDGLLPEHVIQECEYLKVLRKGSTEFATYGVDTAKGNRANYMDPDYENVYFSVWGPDAYGPHGARDPVTSYAAKDYTERMCKRMWMQRYQMPAQGILEGFRSIVSSDVLRHPGPKGQSLTAYELKRAVEGSPRPLDIDQDILYPAGFYGFSDLQQELFRQALLQLKPEELREFLIFFTALDRPPQSGWEIKPKFSLKEHKTDKDPNAPCRLAIGHTCFNLLDVPAGCLTEARLPKFVASLRTAIKNVIYSGVDAEVGDVSIFF